MFSYNKKIMKKYKELILLKMKINLKLNQFKNSY